MGVAVSGCLGRLEVSRRSEGLSGALRWAGRMREELPRISRISRTKNHKAVANDSLVIQMQNDLLRI